VSDYETFLKIKQLPAYRFVGRTAEFADHYAERLGIVPPTDSDREYHPPRWFFDYQAAIITTALAKTKYSVFADCGLGKTPILLEFAREVHARTHGKVLIVSPLMVVSQTCAEAERFFGDSLPMVRLAAKDLADWLASDADGVAITNYDAITDDLPACELAGLILDESSMLKSHYGAWGTRLIAMGRGVPYKLALTGTPAPNDRIEYANHAVFMDAFPTVNSFLARFFVNRGETSERWELKPHALRPFYVALSHWCIFLTNPETYGWRDNCGTLPPIHVHIHEVPSTDAQRDALMESEGTLFVANAGGIGSRGRIARIGKGIHDGKKIDSNKTRYVADLVASWPTEQTIVWCKYNAEQDEVSSSIPDCGNIDGTTPIDERQRIIDAFKAGTIRTIVTKPKILGFGLNLQCATRQVFAGLQDSYEEFYQAVKRSNRYGSTKALNVHIPITEFEAPMVDTVLSKSRRVESDTREQEALFRDFTQTL
jgi:superfamily II DNA or RNA helicase